MISPLPAGWSIDRIRALSGDATAAVVPPDRRVLLEDTALEPELILSFHGLCLVRARDDEDWYMGELAPDGTLTCWSSYGPDLATAIRGL
ncbi:hypothetical protein AB0I68_19155 [Streptomyces sp. NPDC050448]|uniref:hypothetical protein n=1 Tax=Streptomyces sp. NPDC050448 TaxID=3155404 RepID=UPI00342F1A17